MKIFVTGGTGLLGNAIIRHLCDRGDHVLALVRSEPDRQVFEGLDVTLVRGDLDDEETLRSAIFQCSGVVHSAGLIHIGWKKIAPSLRVNRDGSRLIATICRSMDTPMVHVGTVNTLAIGHRDQPSDETTPLEVHGGQTPSSYVISKRAGVNAVLAESRRGLRSAIVHPGFMLGPWDWKPSSGRMMVEVQKSWRPLSPTGGCSLCDVRDVAAGTVAAMDAVIDRRLVENGREFVLAGHNWDYLRLWTEMAKRVGRRAPIKTAGVIPRTIGGWIGNTLSRFSEHESDLNSAAIAMSSQFHFHDSSRAGRELGYQNRCAEQTLDDAAEWLSRFFAA